MLRDTCNFYIWVVRNFLQISLYKIYVYKIKIKNKKSDFHILKRHMSLLYVDFKKFPTNRFVEKIYPLLLRDKVGKGEMRGCDSQGSR